MISVAAHITSTATNTLGKKPGDGLSVYANLYAVHAAKPFFAEAVKMMSGTVKQCQAYNGRVAMF